MIIKTKVFPGLLVVMCGCLGHVVCADDSIITILDRSSQSMVGIVAENAGLFKTPGKAFLDPKTGKILVASNVKVAQGSRRGTGVIIDQAGIIATNAHTVDKAGRIQLTFNDGSVGPGIILWSYPEGDIAFLKAKSLPESAGPLPFSFVEKVKIGETVYNIGGSELLKNTFSQGRITGLGQKRKRAKGDNITDLIQTDFDIYKGDSGGPLLDREGRFLGLFVAGDESGGRASYAIPAMKIKKYYADFLKKEKKK